MLGYITGGVEGRANALLADVAAALRDRGVAVAGVVQVNEDAGAGRPCHMDLYVLGGVEMIRISQDLGALSQGCRLDTAALERAVGLVSAAVEAGPAVLIVNRFGKQEADGRGFRPLIGEALAAGVPVLVAVTAEHLAAFEAFADGMGQRLELCHAAILEFCRENVKDLSL